MMDSSLSCKELSVNWGLIDDNLLELIAKRLDAMDYIRFRSVCKTWRSISIEPDYRRNLLPWLITGCDRVDGRLFYISFSDGKFHSIAVPALKELNKRSLELGIVSCQGWLVLQGQHDSRAISLLNPLTGAHVHLPEAPKDLFSRRIQYNVHFDPLLLRPEAVTISDNYIEIQYLIHRMAMSCNPSSSSSTDHCCTIVVISAVSKALVSLRMGVGSSWSLMDNQSKYEDVSFCYPSMSFLAVDCLGQVSIFSGMNLNKLRTIVGSPSLQLRKAEWKFSDISKGHIVLLRKVSDHEGCYISFKDKKLPFYKTKRVSEFTLVGDYSSAGGFGQVRLLRWHIKHSVTFYGIRTLHYSSFYLCNAMSDSTYIAGEHGEVTDDDDSFVFYITVPKAFHMINLTSKPLLPQLRNNLISLWHIPQPF